MVRCLVARMATLNKSNNPLSQIHGIGSGHRESPPHPRRESRTAPYGNPSDSVWASNAL